MTTNQNSGYPLKWFQNQEFVRDLYECVICLEVTKDTVQVQGCGHLFCQLCLEDVLKTEAKCPSCRKVITQDMIFKDSAAKRAIQKLRVNCETSQCSWSGNLNSFLEEHQAGCPFRPMECSNAGCDMKIIQKELEAHLGQCEYRSINCSYCKEEYVFKDITDHLNTCTRLPVQCPLQCSSIIIPRNEVQKHIDEHCLATMIKCKYWDFGCQYECERKDMEQHLRQNTTEHLDLSVMEISRLRKEHEKDIKELKQTIVQVNYTGTYTLIITDFNKKLSEAKDRNDRGVIKGDPFYSSVFGYKMKMEVVLNDTREIYKGYMGVYIALMKSDHDSILSWPFNKSYTFTLIVQQDNEEERNNIEWSVTPEGEKDFERPKDLANLGYGYPKFVSHTTLETRKYIKDDTVFITVSVKS